MILMIQISYNMSIIDCSFDFEKLMLKCKDFKKTITFLNLELEYARNKYEIVIGNKKKLISGTKRISKDR